MTDYLENISFSTIDEFYKFLDSPEPNKFVFWQRYKISWSLGSILQDNNHADYKFGKFENQLFI